jgi:hypothetical protein
MFPLLRISRRLHLEASIWVDRALDNFPSILDDPRSAALWDKSVDHVEVHSDGPLQVGSTFDTIGPARRCRPGQRTCYRVAVLDPMTNKLEIMRHPFFVHGTWTMHLVPEGERTKVDCAVDALAKRRCLPILLVLIAARGSLFGDLGSLKTLIETHTTTDDEVP